MLTSDLNNYLILFFGLILLLIPFLLIGLFENKKKGFIYTLFFVIVWHTAVSFFTQLFKVFTYEAVIALNILAALTVLTIFFKYQKKENLNKIFRIDIVALIVLAIFSFNLYQVHYNYTGKINLATDTSVSYHEIKNFKYPYPYYSDEWYSIAFIKENISSKSLPLENPFIEGSGFINPELFFHSFLSGIILLLSFDPLTKYTILSIFINSLIALLLYLFLRIEKVGKLSAAIASLALLYITSSANLPGIWNLIPMTMGVLTSLMGFCFIGLGEKKLALINSILVFLFYPPFIFFYFIALIFAFWEKGRTIEAIKVRLKNFVVSIFLAIPVFYILFMIFEGFSGAVKFIFSKIFYPSFSFGLIPQYAIYKIIPWPVILISIFGIYFIYKRKKWLVFQIAAGIFLWVLYSFINYRIIVEFQRAVFFTSVLLVIAFGFGLQKIEKYLKEKSNVATPILKYTGIGFIVFFLVLTPFYTRRENWKDLVLIDKNSDIAFPKAPANMYLTDDDLKIFKDIKQKKFLSISWKGTVIAVATDNIPVLTKGGTITISSDAYRKFIISDCENKSKIAKESNIDYVYTYQFYCPDFKEINRSSEGFILYEFQK